MMKLSIKLKFKANNDNFKNSMAELYSDLGNSGETKMTIPPCDLFGMKRTPEKKERKNPPRQSKDNNSIILDSGGN